MSKNFAITGVAGYIAPRHLKAIKVSRNNLVAAFDPHDSVGVMDSYFYDVAYFKEFERFDRHIQKRRRGLEEEKIHYVSICSPNYVHDAHVYFAMRIGADAICEKPLVINPWNCDFLEEMEAERGRKINTILQLRLHPAVKALKEQYSSEPKGAKHEIDLTYITSRGKWYLYSWKGDFTKSGGLVTNIGVHFFDMLTWMFGSVERNVVHVDKRTKSSGYLELERAKIRWFLSIDNEDLPKECHKEKKTTFRSILIDGKEVEFSGGFTDLHTESYKEILAGRGFGIKDCKPSIQLVHDIRMADVKPDIETMHPFAKKYFTE